MSKKTKAEKIAIALRARRSALQNASVNTISSTDSATQRIETLLTSSAIPRSQTIQNSDADVYEPKDLRKTIVVTLFVVALLALVYVFQFKGYF